MSKRNNYVISKLTVNTHHRIYLTGYNPFNFTAKWSKNIEDAELFESPVKAQLVINCIGVKDADALRVLIEIVEKKEIKEMNNNVIIQSDFVFKGRHVLMYVKTVEPLTGAVKYTKDRRMARKFGSVEIAEIFIAKCKPHSPRIVYYHDDMPDALRYCAADVKATTEFMNEIYNTESETDMKLPEIKNVIFSNPATIVFWADGTKTVVKCQKDETYDPEKGLSMAITKKALGNNYEYYNTIKHWLKKAPKVETSRFYCDGTECRYAIDEHKSTKAGE